MNAGHIGLVRTGEHAPVSDGQLWFGLASGPAVWSLQELFGWFFGARICASLAAPSVRLIVAGIGLAALAVAVAGATVSWRNWHRTSAVPKPPDAEAWDRATFMAMGGFLVSTASIVAVLWATLPPLFLSACGWMR